MYLRLIVVLLFLLLASFDSVVLAVPTTVPSTRPTWTVEEVVAQLTTESEKLLDSDQTFYARRPHPLMKPLEPHRATKLLARLGGTFTGDSLRDTYIRYHLMWAVLEDGNSDHEFTTTKFIDLANALPMTVIVEKDISRDLQADSDKNRDSFDLLTNIYLYAAGQDSHRPRISTNYIAAAPGKITRTIKIARVRYDGSFDPEPMALPQLKAMLASQKGIDLDLAISTPAEMKDAKVAFLTTSGRGTLTDDQAKSLRQWIDAGGTLWLDVAGGSSAAAVDADAMLAKLGFSSVDLTSAQDSQVFTAQGLKDGYPITSALRRSYSGGEKTSLSVIKLKDRAAVYFTRSDIASSLAGINSWGIAGYSVSTVRKLVGNSLLALK